MIKHKIVVPKGIRYISDWDSFEDGKRLRDELPKEGQYIMNKTITGCGYTEYWITNDIPAIICSPRLILLENKEDQHQGDKNVLYLKNEFDSFEKYDQDINRDRDEVKGAKEKEEERKMKAEEYTKFLKKKIHDHIDYCFYELHKPPKFLVTYDSFRRIKEELGNNINNFYIIVDEFQSIFCDSRFKSDVENEFMESLRGLKKVCYLSATPMIEKYLNMLPEFQNLPYYELDWASLDKTRVKKPYLKTKQVSNLLAEVYRIVNQYKTGDFESLSFLDDDNNFHLIESKEAVIYINSVKNICEIIRKCGLKLEETNVLCANDSDNEKKIRSAFRKVDNTVGTKDKCIGKVPKEGEPHKMFTLCTRTTYLGADFYSTNARSFIFSDANVDCLSVDITLDLPQILGRQRLETNPWKDRAELYFKVNTTEKTQEEFDKYLEKKEKMTESLLKAYEDTTEKHNITQVYKERAIVKKYKDDFVAVNKHSGSDIKPVKNNLVKIAEMRAFEIQQFDYKERFTVFNTISDKGINIEDINSILDKFFSFRSSNDKLKYLCSLPESTIKTCLPHLPEEYINYINVLGMDRIRANGYNISDVRKEFKGVVGNQEIDIKAAIIEEFEVDEIYSKAEVKKRLGDLYKRLGYSKTPRAVDLGDYFIIKNCQMTNKDTGKRDHMYKIVSIKEETIKDLTEP